MKAWFCIPSARPATEANQVLGRWRERGYGVALWLDSEAAARECNFRLVGLGQYPGYAAAVNLLAKEVLAMDPECEWIVAGGDDTEPDDLRSPEQIAGECREHFGGTFGVMQPTGDRWADGSIDRIAGSPWMGREWCMRANGGQGPLWPEFTHMFVDECLQQTAIRCGAFWQRRDVVHFHRHYLREGDGVKGRPAPAHLRRWSTPQHWKEMQAIYHRLRAQSFAPCMPIEMPTGVSA
jgi:hypothetical protein